MSEEVRKKYELEKLWTLGRNYDDQYRELEAMSLDPSDNSWTIQSTTCTERLFSLSHCWMIDMIIRFQSTYYHARQK